MTMLRNRNIHRWVATAVAIAFVGLLVSPMAARAADGKDLFLANKCNNCHTMEKFEIDRKINSEKTNGPDLSTVGDRHEAAWIVKFVKKEETLHDKNHLNNYKGSDKDLENIAAWLASLKAS